MCFIIYITIGLWLQTIVRKSGFVLVHCTMVTDNSTKILIAFMYIVTITETYQKTVTNNSTQELFLYMYIL